MTVHGFADLHAHPVAHASFNSAVLQGAPWDPPGHCNHSILSPISYSVLGTDHNKNPTHHTKIHQQMFADQYDRLYDAGLRLMVCSFTNNVLLAEIFASPEAYDHKNVLAQLCALRELVQCVPRLAVVGNAKQARSAIANGKIACIISLELDRLFGEPVHHAEDLSHSHELISRQLDYYSSLGARIFHLAHVVDSPICGCAVYEDLFNIASAYLKYKFMCDCGQEDYYFKLQCASKEDGYLFKPKNTTLLSTLALGPDFPQTTSYAYGEYGMRNAVGLTAAGVPVIEQLRQKGLLVDGQHMSQKAVDEALDLNTPLFFSHDTVRFVSQSEEQYRETENSRTDEQLQRLPSKIIGLGTGTEKDTLCKFFDQAEDLIHRGYTVAFGTDFNGLGGQPKGLDYIPAVGPSVVKGTPYFLRDGLSHYGMLADVVYYLKEHRPLIYCNMMQSTEAFLQHWESYAPNAPDFDLHTVRTT